MGKRPYEPVFGSPPTARELQLFHAWMAGGDSEEAAKRVGCGSQNILAALARLRVRYGVKHTPQLVPILVITPAYVRLRRLEKENRALRKLTAEVLEAFTPSNVRQSEGGVRTRVQRRRWRKAKAAARQNGVRLTVDTARHHADDEGVKVPISKRRKPLEREHPGREGHSGGAGGRVLQPVRLGRGPRPQGRGETADLPPQPREPARDRRDRAGVDSPIAV